VLGAVEGCDDPVKTVGALVSPDGPEKMLGPVVGTGDDENKGESSNEA